jgi:glycosyltransferase involved in cell wall biosynthesis
MPKELEQVCRELPLDRSVVTLSSGTRTTELASPVVAKTSITIVVPCFNEEPALINLRDELRRMEDSLGKTYDVHVILVDDGSTDKTWHLMQELFANEPNYVLLRQPRNFGVAAAILSGIRRANTEIVCSIDSDCTYNPQELSRLIPMLTPGVDLVTASPYHPLGEVRDVPHWRLALSKAASSLYRQVLRHKLYTYTSCFRVYRRSAIVELDLQRDGFLGITELIGKLDMQGSKIVECPATLAVRAQGVSKMRTARVLVGHLYLLGQLLAARGQQRFFR